MNEDELGSADAPRSELERTIEELTVRANRVLETQGRLRSLLAASRSVVEDLDIESVLRRIVEAAVALVEAEYGALGVIARDGGLERFIHVGMPVETTARIGNLPEGNGILGAVIETAAPIRLEHLSTDARSVGFPQHHPPMDAFLGVPIRVRDEVFGNLYLTNPRRGTFSKEDEELVMALAATAGIAIENARLFDDVGRRQRWSTALAEVTAALLSDQSADALAVVADRVASVVDADLVTVVVGAPDDADELLVTAARGDSGRLLDGRRFPRAGSLVGRALETGGVVQSDAPIGAFSDEVPVGPIMLLPFGASKEPFGVLAVARAAAAPRFSDADVRMAGEFAAQAGVAIELSRARADRARLELVEDRNRIARDLHDNVIQRLFGIGLALQGIAAAVPAAASGIADQVDSIDAAIAEIRTAVYALTSRRRRGASALRHRLLDIASESATALGSTPRMSFSGPVDLLVTGDLAEDVLSVVRECLLNTARHADAGRVDVSVEADDERVIVTVTDDGRGLGRTRSRAGGTANLAERAERRGGEFSLRNRPSGGARAVWRAPIDQNGAHP